MTLIRWNPYRGLSNLSRELNDCFGTGLFQGFRDAALSSGNWAPAIDVQESKDAFELLADLPGMKKEDIQISLDDGVVTIKGEKQAEKEPRESETHFTERVRGPFERSLKLPGTVNAAQVRAEYRDGVLYLTLPKAEEAKTKQIQVQ